MCGVVGIVGQNPVAQDIYDALIMLQHRGQDAAGIATLKEGRFFLRKANGLVNDVFREEHMQKLFGKVGIGHTRYPTAGSSSSAEAQPMYVNSPYGIMMAHNGNLTNSENLMQEVFKADLRHINTRSDTEVLLNVFAHELAREAPIGPTVEHVFEAIKKTHQRLKGAYAVVALISNFGLVAFRDIYAIRPLIYGSRVAKNGKTEYMVASESAALLALGFKIERDLEPGECIIISEKGEFFSQKCGGDKAERVSCIFEYVYFARADSTIDGVNVYKSRLRMGEKLANKILSQFPNHDIDVVIPIPDTSRPCAIQLAKILGVKYREGFFKNNYIGRTFIMPMQNKRAKSVRQKLSTLELEFRRKNVLLVDDSIVRGTTSEQLVQLAREAGAKKVYLASAAPEIRYPNVYGIDMPVSEELIAYGKTCEEVAKKIGADKVFYQSLEDLIDSCRENKHILPNKFDCSIFNGKYITGDIDENYLNRLKELRSDTSSARHSPIVGSLEEII